jgi:hypothetical protein
MPITTSNYNLIKICKGQYRNPVFLARERRKGLGDGKFTSSAAPTLHVNISRARVTQILNLLKLAPNVVEMISSLGDLLRSHIISKRRLRPLLALNTDQQEDQVEIIMPRNLY